ncbi:hypothetical protein LNN31_18090 [Acetobacterium wieringae]|uniref:DUF5640 domain-containing protein n=1 Tax=Acetobacterium wieringae TaxID=52694 RepID=A0ABY6HFJ7_9FIRM|nr:MULTISPECIES: hypothetical protein [Acetobacterium]OXS26685.1 MAG: hypothetical protein BI182_02970 [Acetobacterium sp. MES1]UYO62664.1 hypothetical protein LNN31_18090 [Acetobacterium wieringae]VUZ24948.1 Uncharacterised protein [Acetobacterium wieringae]
MTKNIWIHGLTLLLIVILCGCSVKPVAESQPSLSNNDPAQLIGKWEFVGDNGYYETYEFTPDHQVIIENRTLGKWVKVVYTYEDVSGLLVLTNGQRFESDQFIGTLDNLGMINYHVDNHALFIFNNTYNRVDSFSQSH